MTEFTEDFDFEAEIALLEQQGASAQKYFMHSNAHQMAFAKYATSAKSAKEMGNAALAKKLNAMGKKHKTAAEALGALAGHHVDHEFSRQSQMRIKKASQMTEETLVENFVKTYKPKDGYEGRRSKQQVASGKHIAKILGNKTQIQHHEKGGLNIYSKSHGQPGNNKHVRQMADTLKAHGIPHRYEDHTGLGRQKDRLYVTSYDAHDHGHGILSAKVNSKLHNDHHADRERLVQHNEEVEVTDNNELNELSKMKLQKYSRLASKDKNKDRSKGVALAQDKLREEEELDLENSDFVEPEMIEVDLETIVEDEEAEFNPIQELIAFAIDKKPTDFTSLVQDIIRSHAADRLEQLSEETARKIGGTIEEISVPPTGKPVLADQGKTISDPSTKSAPTLKQGKNGSVKGNAKTPEQKSVSVASADTFRTQEAAK
jgi:hypothetical protein